MAIAQYGPQYYSVATFSSICLLGLDANAGYFHLIHFFLTYHKSSPFEKL